MHAARGLLLALGIGLQRAQIKNSTETFAKNPRFGGHGSQSPHCLGGASD